MEKKKLVPVTYTQFERVIKAMLRYEDYVHNLNRDYKINVIDSIGLECFDLVVSEWMYDHFDNDQVDYIYDCVYTIEDEKVDIKELYSELYEQNE